SGDSYLSQSDMRLHFGLEKRAKVDLIQVRWPSGQIDKVSGVGVNRIITIKEGQGKDEKQFASQKGT
ncbi:MAG TPA: ASPIC/UnbV domain-containing protein, partial [Pyrinomonadaceae bacterium]|nr:ASPIC/UnbV domain-containing protein [Pyrinomonadaceae bacterium]